MSNYLAVFVGSKNNPRMAAWMAMSDAERKAKEQEGIAAWGAWMEKNKDVVVGEGGPLGKTKRVSGSGIADVSNEMGAFVVVRAESHEAAAKLFEKHPHFTIFPGEAIEVMPIMPIPGR
jgi:phosphoketolase